MPCGPADGSRASARPAHAEPFAWGAASSMTESAKAMSLMWTLPLRTFMVVMGEAARTGSDRAR